MGQGREEGGGGSIVGTRDRGEYSSMKSCGSDGSGYEMKGRTRRVLLLSCTAKGEMVGIQQ